MHDYTRFLQEFERFRLRARQLFEEHVLTETGSTTSGEWTPAVDVYETEDRIVLTAEISGVRREDVDIEVRQSVLTLRGKRFPECSGPAPEGYMRMEIPFGRFERSFMLPCAVSAEGIEARLRDGVLTVTVPRCAAPPGRRIVVEAS